MSLEPLSRADFLKILAAGSAGIVFLRGADEALARVADADDGLDQAALDGRLDPALERAALDGERPAAAAAGPIVAVVRGRSIPAVTKKAIALCGGMKTFVKHGDDVIIKPNICVSYRSPKYAATTNPTVVATLVRLALGAGAKRVRVMDKPFSGSSSDAYSQSGIAAAVKKAGGSMQIMSPARYKSFAIPDGKDLKNWTFYRDILDCDCLINVPIAKVHGLTRLTLGGKNMMGVVGNRPGLHSNPGTRIADIMSKIKPDLSVVDAIRILVRNGPSGGNTAWVRRRNTVIASPDWVAADSYAARLFKLTGDKIPYVASAAKRGLGIMDLSRCDVKKYVF